MTERKPPGARFESWVEQQIRVAEERGDFAKLPGFGKPLPGDAHRPYDEDWWVKEKMRREQISFLPPALALRKEAEDALAAAVGAGTEAQVRRIVAEINEKIAAALRMPPPGPPLQLAPFDVEEVLTSWRERRGGQEMA
ncbi:DnaJ family domain-containing protein [Streptomyces sp. NPDC002536]